MRQRDQHLHTVWGRWCRLQHLQSLLDTLHSTAQHSTAQLASNFMIRSSKPGDKKQTQLKSKNCLNCRATSRHAHMHAHTPYVVLASQSYGRAW